MAMIICPAPKDFIELLDYDHHRRTEMFTDSRSYLGNLFKKRSVVIISIILCFLLLDCLIAFFNYKSFSINNGTSHIESFFIMLVNGFLILIFVGSFLLAGIIIWAMGKYGSGTYPNMYKSHYHSHNDQGSVAAKEHSGLAVNCTRFMQIFYQNVFITKSIIISFRF